MTVLYNREDGGGKRERHVTDIGRSLALRRLLREGRLPLLREYAHVALARIIHGG
jgi:hypothetical protein